jgi:DNA-binding CsgD family transcriptional regulator
MKELRRGYFRLKKLFTIVFLTITCITHAQSDQNKNLQNLFTYIYGGNLNDANKLIVNQFIKSNDNTQQVIGYVFHSIYYLIQSDDQKSLTSLLTAKKIANKTNSDIDKAYVDFGYIYYYNKIGKRNLAYKSYIESKNIFSKHSNENFILSLLYINQFKVKSTNNFENYDKDLAIKANEYSIKSANNILISISDANLGNYYLEKSIDSANIYFNKAIKSAKQINNISAKNVALSNAYINMGYSLATKNNFNINEFEKYYVPALELAKQNPSIERNSLPIIYLNWGYIYEMNNQLQKSNDYYLKAYHAIQTIKGVNKGDEALLLQNLSISFEKLGNKDKALFYERKLNELTKINFNKLYGNNTKALEIYYNTEQKNQEIKKLELENSSFRKEIIFYIIFSILTVIIFGLSIYSLLNKIKNKRQKLNLLQAEKNETELTLQLEQEERARLKAEADLAKITQEQLHKKALATSIQLEQKNTVLNELKEKVKDEKIVTLDRILKEDKILDKDFKNLNSTIADVHPNLYNKLKEISKNKLTNRDLKFASYIYLNMDNTKIAEILRVEVKTVRMTKYRLKQKIGLDKKEDLTNFIHNLDL